MRTIAFKLGLANLLPLAILIILAVLSVIDNLVKGAAGQALQAFNIMFGFNEVTGLGRAALLP